MRYTISRFPSMKRFSACSAQILIGQIVIQVLPISENPNALGAHTKVNAKEEWSRRITSSITIEFTYVKILRFPEASKIQTIHQILYLYAVLENRKFQNAMFVTVVIIDLQLIRIY